MCWCVWGGRGEASRRSLWNQPSNYRYLCRDIIIQNLKKCLLNNFSSMWCFALSSTIWNGLQNNLILLVILFWIPKSIWDYKCGPWYRRGWGRVGAHGVKFIRTNYPRSQPACYRANAYVNLVIKLFWIIAGRTICTKVLSKPMSINRW